MGVANGGWQILFTNREKTKARGSPTGRRPYSALVFYGQDLVFKVKPKSSFMLWFQPGGDVCRPLSGSHQRQGLTLGGKTL